MSSSSTIQKEELHHPIPRIILIRPGQRRRRRDFLVSRPLTSLDCRGQSHTFDLRNKGNVPPAESNHLLGPPRKQGFSAYHRDYTQCPLHPSSGPPPTHPFIHSNTCNQRCPPPTRPSLLSGSFERTSSYRIEASVRFRGRDTEE